MEPQVLLAWVLSNVNILPVYRVKHFWLTFRTCAGFAASRNPRWRPVDRDVQTWRWSYCCQSVYDICSCIRRDHQHHRTSEPYLGAFADNLTVICSVSQDRRYTSSPVYSPGRHGFYSYFIMTFLAFQDPILGQFRLFVQQHRRHLAPAHRGGLYIRYTTHTRV